MVRLDDVDTLKVPELKAELKKLGVTGYSRWNKAKLQAELKKALKAKARKSPRKSPRGKSPRKRTPPRARSRSRSRSRSRGPAYTEAQLSKMKVTELNALMDDDSKRLAKEAAKSRGKARPNKAEKVAAILQAQRRAVKGKERKVEKSVEDITGRDVDVEPMPTGARLDLSGWTIVGELEPAFFFLKGFDRTRLRERIEAESTDVGLVRFEPDPTCVNNCGSEVLCVDVNGRKGGYPLEVNLRGGYLQDVSVGELTGKGKDRIRADFFFQENLLIADLDDVYRLMPASNIEEFRGMIEAENVAVVTSKKLASPKRMVLKFRGDRPYNGFYVENAPSK